MRFVFVISPFKHILIDEYFHLCVYNSVGAETNIHNSQEAIIDIKF